MRKDLPVTEEEKEEYGVPAWQVKMLCFAPTSPALAIPRLYEAMISKCTAFSAAADTAHITESPPLAYAVVTPRDSPVNSNGHAQVQCVWLKDRHDSLS